MKEYCTELVDILSKGKRVEAKTEKNDGALDPYYRNKYEVAARSKEEEVATGVKSSKCLAGGVSTSALGRILKKVVTLCVWSPPHSCL
jgi:hypothetical protein